MNINRIGSPKIGEKRVNDEISSPLPESREQARTELIASPILFRNNETPQDNNNLYYHIFYYEQGQKYFENSDFEKAINCFKNAVEKASDIPEYWDYLGIAQSHYNQHEEAVKSLRKATEIDPKNGIYWSNLSRAYDFLGKTVEALETAKKAASLNEQSTFLEILSKIVKKVHQEQGMDKALETYNLYTNDLFNHRDVFYWSTLGSIFLIINDNEACKIAKQCYKRAISIDKENIDNWKRLAQTYAFCTQEGKAIKVLLKVKKIYPNDASICFMLGNFYFIIKKYREAVVYLEKAKMMGYDFHPGRLLEVYVESKEDEKAIALATDMINEDKEDSYPHFALGLVHERKQHFEIAIEFFTKAAELNPESDEPLVYLAGLHVKLLHHIKAVPILEKCVAINPTFENYRELGCAYLHCNELQKAKVSFLKALKLKKEVDESLHELMSTIINLDKHIKDFDTRMQPESGL